MKVVFPTLSASSEVSGENCFGDRTIIPYVKILQVLKGLLYLSPITMQIPKIITKRLILRGFQDEDLDAYAQMCADGETMRYIGIGNTLSRSESWRNMAMMLGHWSLRGYGMWALELKQDGRMIGRVGCWYPDGWMGLEIGWTINREFWRRGYATEAANASLEYAFEELQVEEIMSLIRPANMASRRVAEKIGEQLVGQTQIMGEEALIYRLRRDEWKAIKDS